MLQTSLISEIYKNTEWKRKDIIKRKFLLSDFTHIMKIWWRWEGSTASLDSLVAHTLSFICDTFQDTFKFLFLSMKWNKKCCSSYVTETSSLFMLECEEHGSIDESSGGGKCK